MSERMRAVAQYDLFGKVHLLPQPDAPKREPVAMSLVPHTKRVTAFSRIETPTGQVRYERDYNAYNQSSNVVPFRFEVDYELMGVTGEERTIFDIDKSEGNTQ